MVPPDRCDHTVVRTLDRMETAFTRLVGCRAPIQQAPMGSVSGPDLAAAVADAGGVGTVSGFFMSPEQVERLLTELTARTSGVLGINFLTNDIDRAAVEVAASRLRVVDFFWADPDASLVEVAHQGGALASWQVGSADEARAAVDAGCDFLAAQGIEAGGHVRGYEPVLRVLGNVLEVAGDVPVLAAGGIADAEAFRRVMDAGAAGARVGTRFIATTESGAHPDYKQAIVDTNHPHDTEITDAFAVCPLCATSPRARVLRRAIDAVHGGDSETVGEMIVAGKTVPVPRGFGATPDAQTTGDIAAMAMYAGESVAAVRDIVPAAQVIERLCGDVPLADA